MGKPSLVPAETRRTACTKRQLYNMKYLDVIQLKTCIRNNCNQIFTHFRMKYAVSQREDSLSDVLNINGPSFVGPNGVGSRSDVKSCMFTML